LQPYLIFVTLHVEPPQKEHFYKEYIQGFKNGDTLKRNSHLKTNDIKGNVIW